MIKRLCDLVALEENNKECALLKVKDDVKPIDLIRLGGFDGTETMFRVTKGSNHSTITIFRSEGRPESIEVGSTTSRLSDSMRKARTEILECVGLDFGIFTRGEWHNGYNFDQMVDMTSGPRDLDSPRRFELYRTGGSCSLFVNNMHIAHVDYKNLDEWLADRNIRIEIQETKGFGADRTSVGKMVRASTPERIGEIKSGLVYPARSGQGLVYKDAAAFEKREGVCYIPEWGLDPEGAVPPEGFLLEKCEAYTYDDILQACEGNEEAAKQVFEGLEWQHPETLYAESKDDFEPAVQQAEQGDFAAMLDKCFDEFLKTDGWQRMDQPSAVCEFVIFAKKQAEPSLENLKEKAKQKSSERNASRLPKARRPDMER